MAVDCLGLVLVVLGAAASVRDRDAAVPLLERLRQGAVAGETAVRLHPVAARREATVFTDAERAAVEPAGQGTRIADAAGGIPDEVWATTGPVGTDNPPIAMPTTALQGDLMRLAPWITSKEKAAATAGSAQTRQQPDAALGHYGTRMRSGPGKPGQRTSPGPLARGLRMECMERVTRTELALRAWESPGTWGHARYLASGDASSAPTSCRLFGFLVVRCSPPLPARSGTAFSAVRPRESDHSGLLRSALRPDR